MEIDVIDNWTDMQNLRKEWLALLRDSRSDSLHGTPEWIETWLSTIGNNDILRFVVAHDGKDLVGILPLVVSNGSWTELGGKRMELVSGRRGDYHDVVVRRGRENDVTPKLLEKTLALFDSLPFIVFHHISEDSPNLPILRKMLADRGLSVSEFSAKSPYLVLDRASKRFDGKLGKNHKKNLKWQKNRLKKLGSLELTIYDDEEDVLAGLPAFFETHKKSWLTRGKKSLVGNDSRTQKFFRGLVRSLGCKDPNKRVHFSTLNLDGEAISYHFNFVYNNILLHYVPTYNLDFEKYSPGKVHLYYCLEHAVSHESWRVFDFMVGDEPYKYMWTKTEKQVQTLAVSKKLSFGSVRRWWLKDGKDMARQRLEKAKKYKELIRRKQH